MGMHVLSNEMTFITFVLKVYFKMVTSFGSHFEAKKTVTLKMHQLYKSDKNVQFKAYR